MAAATAAGLGLDVSDDYFRHRQPYFFDYVEDKLIEAYGVNTVRQGGLDVYTTIDPRLQEVGAEAMRSTLPYSEDPSSALVSIDPRNGDIRAMAKKIKTDHELALNLWDTGNVEAQLLATLTIKPKSLSADELDKLTRSATWNMWWWLFQ